MKWFECFFLLSLSLSAYLFFHLGLFIFALSAGESPVMFFFFFAIAKASELLEVHGCCYDVQIYPSLTHAHPLSLLGLPLHLFIIHMGRRGNACNALLFK